jgi:hypothetical protein
VLIPLDVGGQSIDMVLDTGSPLSSISQATYHKLSEAGAIDRLSRNSYVLRRSAIQGQAIRDLVVRISRRVSQVGADGVLGLDFLGQFTDIHLHVPSLRLTLGYSGSPER